MIEACDKGAGADAPHCLEMPVQVALIRKSGGYGNISNAVAVKQHALGATQTHVIEIGMRWQSGCLSEYPQ